MLIQLLDLKIMFDTMAIKYKFGRFSAKEFHGNVNFFIPSSYD